MGEQETVSFERFAALQKELASANAEREKLAAKLKTTETTYEKQLKAAQEAAETATKQLAEQELTWSMDRALLTDGIDDPDVREFLQHKFSSVAPQEGAEKPSFGDWFTEYTAASPAVLRPFLEKSQAPPAATAAPPAAGPQGAVKGGAPNQQAAPKPAGVAAGGQQQQPGRPLVLTPADIAKMSPDQFREVMPSILSGAVKT